MRYSLRTLMLLVLAVALWITAFRLGAWLLPNGPVTGQGDEWERTIARQLRGEP